MEVSLNRSALARSKLERYPRSMVWKVSRIGTILNVDIERAISSDWDHILDAVKR